MTKTSPIYSAYQQLLSKSHLEPNPAQLALVNQLGHLQQSLLSRSSFWQRSHKSQQNGMYIYGGVGTGKSRIADLFVSTLPPSIKRRRTHFHEFMVDVHTRLHNARLKTDYAGDSLLKIGSEICSQSMVLCFDEFQVSDIADAMILKRLFGSFWQSGGIMVATSNRHPNELYLNGLNRPLFIPFIEDLQRRCIIWRMGGDRDYRLGDGAYKRTPVFLTDPGAFSAMMLDTTGGCQITKTEIKVVMNRSMVVDASYPANNVKASSSGKRKKGVVHGTFKELCEATLGASDYHALCKFAHTVFMSGIRPLATTELDYLRRFITLIDIAYESRTRVVCLSTVSRSEVFKDICGEPVVANSHGNGSEYGYAPNRKPPNVSSPSNINLTVKGEGGSSSSMMSTFLNDVEWSATGLTKASLATGGAGETDVRFALGRAISRMAEMESAGYTQLDG